MEPVLILLGILTGSAWFAWWHRQRFGPLLRQVWHTIRWYWLALLVLAILDAEGEFPSWPL